MRLLYHFSLSFGLSVCWLIFARPVGLCEGPGNTGTFWFGLYLITWCLAARSARFFQRYKPAELPSDEAALKVWAGMCYPYLLEIPLYFSAAFFLGADSPDTLTTFLNRSSAPWLFALATWSLVLSVLCGSLLGWRLAKSQIPAHLPITGAAFLCQMTVPLTWSAAPQYFPRLHVEMVVLVCLTFLLLCSRCRTPWLTNAHPPHLRILCAARAPGAILITLSLFTFLESLEFGFTCFSLATLFATPASSPTLLLAWCLQTDRFTLPRCFLAGSLSTYNLFTVAQVFFEQEKAPLMPTVSFWWYISGGLAGVTAFFCVRSVPQGVTVTNPNVLAGTSAMV